MSTPKTKCNYHLDNIHDCQIPLIPVTVKGKNYNFVVNTDSRVNLITTGLWKTIRKGKQVSHNVIDDASEFQIKIVPITFEFGGESYTEKFFILPPFLFAGDFNLPINGSIGGFFLQKHKWVIDYSERILSAGKEDEIVPKITNSVFDKLLFTKSEGEELDKLLSQI